MAEFIAKDLIRFFSFKILSIFDSVLYQNLKFKLLCVGRCKCWAQEVTQSGGRGTAGVDVITNFSGSPGLLVKGGDTKSEGCEFKSRLRILDGHFHINLLYLYCLFEKNEITKKRPRMAQKQIFAWLHNAEIEHSDWLLK